jgi:hypothetical protein
MLRRTLLHWLAATGLLPVQRRTRPRPRPTPPPPIVARDLNDTERRTLRGLAAAVLPAALGAERRDAIADRFFAWLQNYKAGADKGHGYGVTRLATAADSPVVAYIPQLAVLEKAARQRGAKDFATLSNDDQHALIEAAFQGAKVDRLPERPEGKHVAADLMAFFFRSSEANDLCYKAEIGKDTCRDLADSPQRPRPLDDRAPSPGAATSAPRGDAGS